jgi:hypothetical protein
MQDGEHKLINLMLSKEADDYKEWLQHFRVCACPCNLSRCYVYVSVGS